MKQAILTKHLNKTELGKGNTKEGYFYINRRLWQVIETLMPGVEQEVSFISLDGYPNLKTRLTIGAEHRLPGLKSTFESLHLNTEDEIKLIFEFSDAGARSYYYSIEKNDNAICLKWDNREKGFEILSEGREHMLIDSKYNGQSVSLKYKGSSSKRSDSPDNTSYYDLEIGGGVFDGEKCPNMIIDVSNKVVNIRPFENWRYSVVEL